ncbi:MAG: hypothetical protein LW721_08145 [Flammeovirgaceae bacterium]|jgi:hypothetical protein|nr:hypothetical protein [Flammeovirgaceae bacterium]
MKHLSDFDELVEIARRNQAPLEVNFYQTRIRPLLISSSEDVIELNWQWVAAAVALFCINIATGYRVYQQAFATEAYYDLSQFISVNNINF